MNSHLLFDLLDARIEQVTRFTTKTPAELASKDSYVSGRDVFGRAMGWIYLGTTSLHAVIWQMDELASIAVALFPDASVRGDLLAKGRGAPPIEITDDTYAAPKLRAVLGARIVGIESYQPTGRSTSWEPQPHWVTRLDDYAPPRGHKPYDQMLTFELDTGTRFSFVDDEVRLDVRFGPEYFGKVLDLRL